ncbi:MAG TPA: hypothetical protein DEO60_06020 [Bacteroidales bacterium]|jgi:hypothetical protein|nr:hypothetical protein [Bacteroidales bacterium]HBZ20663.1 hypothetical protein [Bacteroidales bacterium]
MAKTSTPFLSYHEIQVDNIDIYEDAFGLYQEFGDVINLLGQLNPVPKKRLTKRLIERVRQMN